MDYLQYDDDVPGIRTIRKLAHYAKMGYIDKFYETLYKGWTNQFNIVHAIAAKYNIALVMEYRNNKHLVSPRRTLAAKYNAACLCYWCGPVAFGPAVTSNSHSYYRVKMTRRPPVFVAAYADVVIITNKLSQRYNAQPRRRIFCTYN